VAVNFIGYWWPFFTFSIWRPMTSLTYALTNKSGMDLRIWKGHRFENTLNLTVIWDNDISRCPNWESEKWPPITNKIYSHCILLKVALIVHSPRSYSILSLVFIYIHISNSNFLWIYSGTCLIRHTKGPGKCVGLHRMSENSGFLLS
jgi:hypothetical protein